jgi:ADP-heptose:LPS heptosyltransferase
MKVDRMRWIDYWVGQPLVAGLAGAHRLWRFFRPEREPTPDHVRRILFIELSEMGSAILADPAMRRARDLYPQAELYFLIFHQNRASLDLLKTVDAGHVLTLRVTSFATLTIDTLGVLYRLWRMRLDLVVDFELFSRFSSLLSLLSGAPLRIGFHRFYTEGLYRGHHLTHPVLYNPYQHIAKNFLALVYAGGEPRDQLPHTKRIFGDEEIQLVPYQAAPEAISALRGRLVGAFPVLDRIRRWVILHPNASELMPLRKWPLACFTALATRLLDDPTLAVLVTGAPEERADAAVIRASTADERLVDLVGFTRLEDLPLLYTLATAMVTNDSGPAHFAAPTRLKTFVLFGPETPRLYGAINDNAEFIYKGLSCSPCVAAANHRRSPCRDNQCMKQITVDEVYARLRAFLDANPGT